jgi:serine/threonine-protein kinase
VSDSADDLDALIESVVNGHAVDWDSAGAGAQQQERRLIEQLRLVARIGALANDPESLPALRVGDRWGALELLGALGRGASGEVWRARDLHLDRVVALKLLPDSVDQPRSPGDEVIHEGHLLSRVRHPNVVTIYGADRHDGRVGLWMECVDGETLTEQLAARGRFEAAEAAAIGIDLCRAVAAIHDAGLVHRDVKPQNVMREAGGRTVLMDLGVGIDLRQPRQRESSAGTPLYLAPELFQGGPPSIASDLYSVGVLLFHLVSATFPIRGATLEDVADAHARADRLALSGARPDLPETFVSIVERALERDPRKRFASASEMQDALSRILDRNVEKITQERSRSRRWLMAGVLAVTVVFSFGLPGVLRNLSRATGTGTDVEFAARNTALVAAFDNHTGDAALDGVLERALAHELAQSPHVVVASTQRIDNALRLMRRPLGTRLDADLAQEIAQRDGDVRLVLAGTVERLDGRFALTVQAIDPEDGTVESSIREESESEREMLSAVRRLATRLRVALGEGKERVDTASRQLAKVTTPSLQALKLYSEAVDAGSRELWPQSESLVRSALAMEPDFPSALNWLGWCLLRNDRPRAEWLPLFERAFQLGSTTSDRERYFLVGSYYSVTGQSAAAIDAYQTLVRLYPDHAWGLNNLIVGLQSAGRRLEIADLLFEMVRARPNDFDLASRAAVEITAARGLEAARPYVDRARALASRSDPILAIHSSWLRFLPVHDHWLSGRAADAEQALRSAVAETEMAAVASPDWRRQTEGWFHLSLGQTGAAESAFARVSAEPFRAVGLGAVALARGDHESIRRHLSTYSGRDGIAVVLLLRAGDMRAAARVFAGLRPAGSPADPAYDAIAAEVSAAADGVPARAVPALRRVVDDTPVAWDTARYYLHVETLATQLLTSGDRQAALRLLETASGYRNRVHRDPTHIGYFWMRVQVRLADLYRELGREGDARAVEADLLRVLDRADEDFVILRTLRGRQSAAR